MGGLLDLGLEVLPCRKPHGLGSFDLHGSPRARVDSGASLPGGHLEGSKTYKLDGLVLFQSEFDRIDDRLDAPVGIRAGCIFSESLLDSTNQVCVVHFLGGGGCVGRVVEGGLQSGSFLSSLRPHTIVA